MSASPATPISFAMGLHPLAEKRARRISPCLLCARHPFEKSTRKGAVQSRCPVVAGRTRFAGQSAVTNSAGNPVHHLLLQAPTTNGQTRCNAAGQCSISSLSSAAFGCVAGSVRSSASIAGAFA